MLPALGWLNYWGGAEPESLVVEAIDRVANAHEKSPLEGGRVPYLAMRRFPVAAAVYSAGIGAVANENYQGLFRVLRDTVFYEYGQNKKRLWTELSFTIGEQRDLWNTLVGRDVYFPVSQLLQDDLREVLADMIPSDMRYADFFDRFEFFGSLDFYLSTGIALGGNFIWRHKRRNQSGTDIFSEIRTEAVNAGPSWKPWKAGLLNGSDRSDAVALFDDFGEAIAKTQRDYRIW
jgi:hypothetical protein